jgi:hypothetical protein
MNIRLKFKYLFFIPLEVKLKNPIINIYEEFDYADLQDVSIDALTSDLEEYHNLGIDKIYFSGDYPAVFFKEVKSFNEIALKEIAKVHHLSWNYRKVMFLVALSPTELRIYNCNKKPFNYELTDINLSKELKQLEVVSSALDDLKSLELIRNLFSRIAVDSGTLWTTENPLRDKIDIRQRIDRYLVNALLESAKALKRSGLDEDIIHSLLMRSIFIMYLEDKGAAKDTKLYSEILKDAQSYLDILNDKKAAYSLFKKLEDHFHGNVFPILKGEEKLVTERHLQVIQKCLIDGDLSNNPKLFTWRLFRFDVIQIEFLSQIYENFLEEFKANKKEESGQYYTPPSLVDLILNEKLSIKNETNFNIKILDPACGSGIFLVESFKRLVRRWKNANPSEQIDFRNLREILKNNIFGIEYDKLAIRVTAFSLYLAIVEHLNPKTLWLDKRYKFPYLINDPKDKSLNSQGANLFRADTIGEIDVEEFIKVDLVIGNPPFGTKISLPSIKNFCRESGFGQDMVIPFMCKSAEFGKEVVLIFNTKVLTNTEKPFQKFRKWLLNENYVEKIYNLSIFRKAPKGFGGQLFSAAVGPVSIIFYQKEFPKNPSSTIEYWAPKTYVKNSLIEGVVIDSTDIKYLPREECQNPTSKVWKIGMWGNYEDFKLLNRLNEFDKLAKFIKENKLIKGLGLQFLDKSTKTVLPDLDIQKLPYLRPHNVERYYTTKDDLDKLKAGITTNSEIKYREYYKLSPSQSLPAITAFRRRGKKETYKGPHLVMKEGLSNKKLCSSYLDASCSFNSKVLGISGGTKEVLKSLVCLLNSDISTYYLFLISASIGIEREEIKPNEIYELPINYDSNIFSNLSKSLDEIKKIVLDNYPIKVDFTNQEKEINSAIQKLFNISKREQILIDDFNKYTLGLIFDGHKSLALKSITLEETKSYAKTLCMEINQFLTKNEMLLNASVYDIKKYHPLNILKLTFSNTPKDIEIFDIKMYENYLDEINKYSISSLSKNIYIQKQIKYFNNNTVYIIKPNQKRFWNRSTALNDAKELISEILKMQ